MSEIYQDSRGWLYTAKQTLDPNTYSGFYRKPGSKSWHRVRTLAVRDNAYDAETELGEYAAKKKMHVTGWYNRGASPSIVLTEAGLAEVESYIKELKAKRKDILDAGKDTADDTEIATIADICSDIDEETIEDYGDGPEYCNGWAVTDSYDANYCLSLKQGEDFVMI